jgi:hypothetical protein
MSAGFEVARPGVALRDRDLGTTYDMGDGV